MSADTIFALASPSGRSGVAVLRISGPAAFEVLTALTQSSLPPARHACVRRLYDPRDVSRETSSSPLVVPDKVSRETLSLVDEALILTFVAPASFTGEDVVELHPHGSPAVIRLLTEILSQHPGVRMAEPGEFTRRAFEHGKMDLTEAEAIGDLIHAETHYQRQQALSQMGGALSQLYHGWAERMKTFLAHIEADLEFPDEDLPDGILPQLLPDIQAIHQAIHTHLDDNNRGERLRDGFHIAIIGAPNAGKSSLVNRFAQREIAIVSDIAGTTRDVIEAHLDLGGYPVRFADTAGLRADAIANSTKAHDRLEHHGIQRALAQAAAADLKLAVFDSTAAAPDADTLALCDLDTLIVLNKSDAAVQMSLPADLRARAISVSCLTGAGFETLTARLVTELQRCFGLREAPSLTRQRHRESLHIAQSHLASIIQTPSLPELVAEDLRLAMRAIGRITGRVDVEDLLDVIFKDFCIGK